MARSLDEFIATLPPDEQAAIEARYRKLKQEVEGLRELRQIAGKAQEDVANALNIKQPSVSKIEKQADMYLSTLRIRDACGLNNGAVVPHVIDHSNKPMIEDGNWRKQASF